VRIPFRYIFFLSLAALCVGTLRAQDAARAKLPRVGSGIDQMERTYFSLFRDVDGFMRAELHADSGDGMRCTVFGEKGDSLIARLSSTEASILSLWLLHYERLSLAGDTMITEFIDLEGKEQITEKLRALSALHARGVIDVDQNRFDDVSAPLIVTRSGDSLRRTLLAVSESSIFLWDSDGSYEAASAHRHLRRIPFDSIRAMRTVASVPLGPAAVFATVATWSVAIHLLSREQTGDRHDIPVGLVAPVLLLPSVLVGLPLGAAASAAEFPVSYAADDDSLTVTRAASKLLPHTLFGANVPPEFRAHGIAGDEGMVVYDHDDRHPYASLPDPASDFVWQLGLETLFHYYDVHYRPTSVNIGLSLSRRFRLPVGGNAGAPGWYVALRPRVAAGTMLDAELMLQLAYPELVSFNAGFAWTHTFETLGKSSEYGFAWSKHWTSSYERASLLQESFAVAGITIATSYGSLEFQYRRVLESPLHTSVSTRDYIETNNEWVKTDFEIKGFWGIGVVLSVGL
jgi:hypothetical protein